MAKTPKVYAAEIDGLNEWIVAAPNQADALAALGVGQNLFAQGLAHPTDDPAAKKAALAAPGVALRRPKGSKAEFKPVSAEPDAGGWAKAAKAVGAKAAPKKPKRDRRALDEAENELAEFESESEKSLDDLRREERRLADRRQDLEGDIAGRRKALTAAVSTAREAFHRG